ncbi:hypothetical protein KV708_08585 [Comamonas thiooxydans]|uniref:hypothetical protein n=1 Tax=Comamonas thiooxydans TaxID=363952 RepID=UPI00070C7602|nr:hypothetical protein [Comamonas thiooxydans]
MEIINIASKTIPWLSTDIKRAINRGDWLLFTSDEEVDSHYFLDIGQKIIHISESGIIGEYEKINFNPDISKIIYFSDIPKPDSLSNAKSFNFA